MSQLESAVDESEPEFIILTSIIRNLRAYTHKDDLQNETQYQKGQVLSENNHHNNHKSVVAIQNDDQPNIFNLTDSVTITREEQCITKTNLTLHQLSSSTDDIEYQSNIFSLTTEDIIFQNDETSSINQTSLLLQIRIA